MQELEERCLRFAKNTRDYCKGINRNVIDNVYINQVIRSSSSIGANYIEANEKLGENDLLMKLRIARREAKETIYWLALLENENMEINSKLMREADELRKILSSIIIKLSNK